MRLFTIIFGLLLFANVGFAYSSEYKGTINIQNGQYSLQGKFNKNITSNLKIIATTNSAAKTLSLLKSGDYINAFGIVADKVFFLSEINHVGLTDLLGWWKTKDWTVYQIYDFDHFQRLHAKDIKTNDFNSIIHLWLAYDTELYDILGLKYHKRSTNINTLMNIFTKDADPKTEKFKYKLVPLKDSEWGIIIVNAKSSIDTIHAGKIKFTKSGLVLKLKSESGFYKSIELEPMFKSSQDISTWNN